MRGILVAIICGILISAMLLPILNSMGGSNRGSKALRDGTQIKQIHEAWIIFARGFDGVFPTPGLINRLPVDVGAGLEEIPGRGDEDISANTTRNLFSLCIMQNYISPEVCIGTTEPSEVVSVCEEFNWDVYDADGDIYWDSSFTADLKTGSNVSYAHMPIFGRSKTTEWRESYNAKFPIIGTRDPLGGTKDPNSITYLIHGSPGQWRGYIVNNDNHLEISTTMFLDGTDNVFDYDQAEGGLDAMLTFTKEMTPEGPVIQHD